MSSFQPERAARVLLDALTMGDGPAAEKHGITTRTVQNHRDRLATDPAFSLLFQSLKAKEDSDWRTVRLRFLRKAIAKLETLVEGATSPDRIRDTAEAIRVVGELQIASDALSVDQLPDQPGARAPEAAPSGTSGTTTTTDG
jgi:hypothetical protein